MQLALYCSLCILHRVKVMPGMQIMKKRIRNIFHGAGSKVLQLILLLIITSGKLTGQDITQSVSVKTDAPALLIRFSEEMRRLGNNFNRPGTDNIIKEMDRLLSGTITDTSSNKLDHLYNAAEEIISLENNLPVYSSVTGNYLPEISYTELSFRLLNAMQRHMEELFSNLPSSGKLMDMPIFSTTALDISQLKTRLLSRQIWILTSCEKKEERVRGWLAVKRMLGETDIQRSASEDKAFQRSAYGIITEPGEIMKKLNMLSENEYYEDVRAYSAGIIKQIDTTRLKYREYTTVISLNELENYSPLDQRINRRALELFDEASQSADNQEKIRLYTEAIAADSAFTAAYNNRGIIYYQEGSYSEAENDFNKALSLDPGYFSAYKYLGYITYKSGRLTEAARNFTGALEYDVSDTLLINRGLCYKGLGEFRKAAADFSSAVKLNAKSINAFYNRVQCYLALKLYEEAANDYHTLIRLQPENSSNYYNLGCVYSIQNKWQQVVSIWEKGLIVNPDDANILKNLPAARNAAEKEKNK